MHKQRVTISVEQRRKIHQMIRDNVADVDILNEFGIVKHTLNSIKREVRDGIVPKAKKSGVRKALKKQAGDRHEVKRKKRTHITLEERHRIHDMIRNHVPDVDILNEFGFTWITLKRIKREVDKGKEPKVKKKHIHVTLEERHQIYDMIRNHIPDVEILDQFGVSIKSLKKFKKEVEYGHEINQRKKGIHVTPEQRHQIHEMIRNEVPHVDILNQFDISMSTLRTIKKEVYDGVLPKRVTNLCWELTDHLNTVVDYFLEKGFPVTVDSLRRIANAWKTELDDPDLIAKYEKASLSHYWFRRFLTKQKDEDEPGNESMDTSEASDIESMDMSEASEIESMDTSEHDLNP